MLLAENTMIKNKEQEGRSPSIEEIIRKEYAPPKHSRPLKEDWRDDFNAYQEAAHECGAHDLCMRVAHMN